MRRGGVGSALALIVVAAILLRPWDWDWDGSSGAEPGAAGARDVLVSRVVDGDTIEVELGDDEEDVRLIGIDTPETVKQGTPIQCFGPQASDFTHRTLEGQRVRLVYGAERRDKYGRLLSYVYLGDRFLNAELVAKGLARSLTIPPNDRFSGLFKRLELEAARDGRGLWDACGS